MKNKVQKKSKKSKKSKKQKKNIIKNIAIKKYIKIVSEYKGRIKNNKRDGHGVMRFENGDIYDGEWKDDKMNGNGFMKFNNGDIYIGEWKDDNKNSFGFMKFKNGDSYIGKWENDKMDGFGVIHFNNGDKYEGNWVNNKMNGFGIMKFNDGDIYEGNWKDGKFYERGKLTQLCKRYIGWGNSECVITQKIYNGEWIESNNEKNNNNNNGNIWGKYKNNNKYIHFGLKNGNGEMIYDNGDKYNGMWQNDEKSGFGIYIFKCGNIFEGNFLNNDFEKGKIFFENGDIFEGTVSYYNNSWGNLYSLSGVITHKNGNIFEGTMNCPFIFSTVHYLNGKLTYFNGDINEGKWLDNTLNGQGKKICNIDNNKITMEGMWKNDLLDGYGKIINNNIIVFEGKFKNGIRDGYGKEYFMDGTIREGIFFANNFFQNNSINYDYFENDFYSRKIFDKKNAVFIFSDNNNDNDDNVDDDDQTKIYQKYCIVYDKKENQKYFQILTKNKILNRSLKIDNNINDELLFKIIIDLDNFDLEIANSEIFIDGELNNIYCPISHSIMFNPITLSCGHSFDKKNILQLIASSNLKNQNCPCCRKEIIIFEENNKLNSILQKCKFKINDNLIECSYFEIFKFIDLHFPIKVQNIDENYWTNEIIFND